MSIVNHAVANRPGSAPFLSGCKQRYEDAQYLIDAGRTTGAVYMAGYGVECMLKAIVLAQAPPKPRAELLRSFRGRRAHDYDWLKTCYFKYGGVPFPKETMSAFDLLKDWNTDLRYLASILDKGEASVFMKAAGSIMKWIDGRT